MRILLLGSSGHAKVVIDIIKKQGKHELVGILDPHADTSITLADTPVLGSDADLASIVGRQGIEGIVVAVGDNWRRHGIADNALKQCPALSLATCIHPTAAIGENATIGQGSVLMAASVVNPSSRIGCNSIINTNASVDHDCTVGNCVSLAPNACLGGNVKIGDYTAISLGANIIHGITIGEHTVIGAGSTVVKDIPSHCVAYGNPCRVIRPRQRGEKYL